MIRIARKTASVDWIVKWSTRRANSLSRAASSSIDQVPTSITTERTAKVHSSLNPDGDCLDYARSWAWQHVLLSRRLAARHVLEGGGNDDGDCVLLLEHAPVYTLGRGADEAHLCFLKDDNPDHHDSRRKLSRKVRGPGTARLAVDRYSQDPSFHLPLDQAVDQLANLASPVLAPNGVPIYRVERGGEVTFHGPRQLVVYPLLDLQRPPLLKDLHWYLRTVEEVIIQTLGHYGITGTRDDKNTGVWVGDDKVAAVGISSSRWITTHGFAINVDPDLDYFDTSVILPCGIQGKGVTSMAKVLLDQGKDAPSIHDVSDVVVGVMNEVFGIRLERAGSVS